MLKKDVYAELWCLMGDKTAAVVVYVAAFVCVFCFQSEGYSEHLPGFNFL